MRNLTEKESLQLYGQIVADFVNAQDTDEAYLNIIKGIQKAFNISPNFTEKAIKHLPSLKKITSNLGENLNKKEMEILKLYPKYYGLRGIIGAQVYRLMLIFEGYDHEKDKLVFISELDHDRKNIYISIDFDEKNSKSFLKQFEKCTQDRYEPRYNSDKSLYKLWQKDNHELLETAKKYKELCLKLNKSLKILSEVGHSKFKKVYEYKSIEEHDQIAWLQKIIQIILTRIMERRSLNRSIYINDYLEVYNEHYQKYLVFHPDGTFSYQTLFSREERYFEILNWFEERIAEHASGKFEGVEGYENYRIEEVVDNLVHKLINTMTYY